jgi:DNA-binding CsgD family transcriptional regulator
VGREEELALLRDRLTGDRRAAALVLAGGPGVGKTTLWEAAVELARARRVRVLATRPSGAEAHLSFAGLVDLLEGVEAEALAPLQAPQRHALEVALLRAAPTGGPPDASAISVGFLNALRALASRRPLLVAVDDVQWLDRQSADVLAFAARRLRDEPVTFLLARRPGPVSPLERGLTARGPEQLDVGPLSLGGVRRLLYLRLGLVLPRHVLRRVFEATAGNALYALEVGRLLVEQGVPPIGKDVPVPDAIEDLLGTQVARLARPVRRLLLAVALSGDARASRLGALADPSAVDAAADAGVLVVDGDHLRVAHPLLAAAVKQRSRASERRELHLALADVSGDEELRAHHLALATSQPDPALAATVAAAAEAAAGRGAAQQAVVLAEHALRLTPPRSLIRNERLFALAAYLDVAGEPQRVTDLLAPELESLPPGVARARGELLLADGAVADVAEHKQHLERALAESEDDPPRRAHALAKLAIIAAATEVRAIPEAEARALEALAAAPVAGPYVERLALIALAWARGLRGGPVDDLVDRFHAASDVAFHIADSVDRIQACRLGWLGLAVESRESFTRQLDLADERAEPWSSAVLRLNLFDNLARSGELDAAARLLEEWQESSDRDLLAQSFYDRCRAVLALSLGFADEARRRADEAAAGAEAAGETWQRLQALRIRGVAHLLAHEPARAAESLRAVWEHKRREGVEEPGAFPVEPDLVEALAELGELDEAREVTAWLERVSTNTGHPWGSATAKRCDGVVRLAGPRFDEGAAAALADAAAGYERLGLHLDAARALLSLGRGQRRFKKWGGARRSLEQAVAVFERVGSPGWAAEAQAQLARVGARRPQASGELTPAERRVVELAVEGRSNKEIASALFVTVHTVEAHLSHAYAKLGVRSRAQLAGRLAAQA